MMLFVRKAASYLITGSGMGAGLTAPAIQLGMLAGSGRMEEAGPV
ncbi:MAG: hypothetical protein ACOC6J_00270 [Spirochaetota bacterium]